VNLLLLLLPTLLLHCQPQMHLHMLDPSRPMALSNKSDSVLDSRQQMLGSWWSPVPHSGTHYLDNNKKKKQQQQQQQQQPDGQQPQAPGEQPLAKLSD
jgi:transcription initiation factor TFIID subunit TAF12